MEKENIKQDYLEDGYHPRIEGQFVVCLTSGTNFIASSVWYMDTRNQFRFSVPAGGEHRFEKERVEQIIRINAG